MTEMEARPIIRPFDDADAAAVREVFIRVNQNLAPDHMAEAFDAYVIRSLREEIDRITDYYKSRDGSFFVVEQTTGFIGFYGLESAGPDAMELRRMYVDPSHQGSGIGRTLLAHAEAQARQRGKARLILSTSELQVAALSLYRASGYRELRDEIVESQSNKALGAGLRRFHFEKSL